MSLAEPFTGIGLYLRKELSQALVFGYQAQNVNMVFDTSDPDWFPANITDNPSNVGVNLSLKVFLDPGTMVFGCEYYMNCNMTK